MNICPGELSFGLIIILFSFSENLYADLNSTALVYNPIGIKTGKEDNKQYIYIDNNILYFKFFSRKLIYRHF